MNLATLDDVTKKRPGIGIYTRTRDERSSDSFYSLIRLRRIKETKSLRNKDPPKGEICKYHLKNKCQFGTQCRNIHINKYQKKDIKTMIWTEA